MIKTKNIVITLLLIITMSIFCTANDLEEETYQGTSFEENNFYEDANVLSSEALSLQETSAENNDNQIGYKLVTVEARKELIIKRISIMWGLIAGLFVIIFDVLKSIMYIIEVYFMFLMLFKLFPMMLVKVKNSITNWYLEKI